MTTLGTAAVPDNIEAFRISAAVGSFLIEAVPWKTLFQELWLVAKAASGFHAISAPSV